MAARRHHHHRDLRRRRDSELGSILDAGDGNSDAPFLRGVDRHREVAQEVSAAARERALAELRKGRSYELDRFQLEAIAILDERRSVLVAAPTGSGKTVVAEYAIHLALGRGQRAFYTSPLKALSNQKFGDLSDRLGRRQVGLLTGDNSINPNAPVVVMTTEVCRNMIYADPARLDGVAYVILDEVHYLEDRYRGAVWEEVILNAPAHVELVCLSATVSNAEQVAGWISSVRGEAGAVIEEKRPVTLEHLFAVGDRTAERIHLMPTFVDGRPNPVARQLEVRAERATRTFQQYGARRRGRPKLYRPRRIEVIDRLADLSLLPAIYFVFSRAGCDDAVRHCLEAGLRLSNPDERRRAREILEAHVEALSDEDLDLLGYDRLAAGLEAGVAAHHAGMVPAFKEAVEQCFEEAVVKVVFATETLALGINMPARTVVIEQLSKFNGDTHEDLTPGEYTQLTGRAGRRGIDDVGYAVALYSPYHSFVEIASLASARSRALRSSFRPTYNMTVNLVRTYPRKVAYHLVGSSFAQYLTEGSLRKQLDRVVGVLSRRGYVRGWQLTEQGERLTGIYHDTDLLVCEMIGAGLLEGLDPPSVAALVSTLTYEPRRGDIVSSRQLSTKLLRRYSQLAELAAGLRKEEAANHLQVTREPDLGFAPIAFAWARGEGLGKLLSVDGRRRIGSGPTLMTGGDFVRTTKQLVDLLRQIGTVLPGTRPGRAANVASEQLLHGVVAAASILGAEQGESTQPGGYRQPGSADTIHDAVDHAT
jgi:superfamily II RNA helicase